MISTATEFFSAATALGDSGFLLPASGGLFAFLWSRGARRSAAAFALGLLICVLATIGAKLAFMACGPVRSTLHSPSGHASLATMFFGSLAYVFVAAKRRGFSVLAAALCLLVIAVVAVSRIQLEAHSVSETVAGLALGASCFALFMRFGKLDERLDLRAPALALVALLAAVSILGASFSLEPQIENAARRLRLALRC